MEHATRPSLPAPDPRIAVLLQPLRDRVRDLCRAPGNRMGSEFFEEHVLLVERFVRGIAPLLGADLAVVVPAAILHDVAAIEDFSRVSEHHELGAVRALGILLEAGFAEPLARRIADCCRLHVRPVDPLGHGPDAACLSHADALAQMSNPAFWIHYAGVARGLGFADAREWYRGLVSGRIGMMTDPVATSAIPLLERALDFCRGAREPA